MSLQPGLISYVLCLHTEPFPLSALSVVEARHRGLVCVEDVAVAILWQFPGELIISEQSLL